MPSLCDDAEVAVPMLRHDLGRAAPALPAAVLLVLVVFELVKGWVPLSDDAVIASRSWDVLSRAVPLVGQPTVAHGPGGHLLYDVGRTWRGPARTT